MIEKMEFVSIIGPKGDMDRVINQYLDHYEIQLENTLTELKDVKNLNPYMEVNPYKETVAKANMLTEKLSDQPEDEMDMSIEEAVTLVEKKAKSLEKVQKKLDKLEAERKNIQGLVNDMIPFRDIAYDIQSILHFRFIKYRFGKISKEYYDKLQSYVYDELSSVFYKCQCDKDYVWGVYFVPASEAERVDAVYTSLHFERLYMKDAYEGTNEEAYNKLMREKEAVEEKIRELEMKREQILHKNAKELLAAKRKLNDLTENHDVRKMAAFTQNKSAVSYILCGWMTKKDAESFAKEIEGDENVFCFRDAAHESALSKPPTKLKNPKIFKPFEMFIRMYGLPDYNEFDPTIFVAITYSFIFGVMFGDVGQGLCLCVGGFLLYALKKSNLVAIIGFAGIFSTIFGFMFGSVFGFENVIEPIWLRPVSNMTTLPFIGNLNTVFVVTVAFGMGLILLTMIFHIINGIKAKNKEAIFFDTNGIAGLVFYGAVVAVVVLFMTGNPLPGGIVLGIMFGVPLLCIAFKEPLTALVEKKAEVMPKEKGMFIVQAVFELIEVLLSYFSNTLSFVRIGAFAVSHAAMMEVVLMLAGAENGAAPNWIVVVLGNIFVCGMEGLIVGIQVLRLEYYEFFSRFYKGGGREFKPYKKVKNM